MIDKIAAGGLRELVFAGGDPSLRLDIGVLIQRAHVKNLKVEVQTNAHLFERVFVPLLRDVDLFGFSLDSAESSLHDTLRGVRYNHQRVLDAISICEKAAQPYVVRTIVTAQNIEQSLAVGEMLARYRYIKKWSLLEFTSIGEGYLNQAQFALASGSFDKLAARAKKEYPALKVDAYPERDKGGVYCLVKPNGDVYTTKAYHQGQRYESVGNLLLDGLEECLKNLSIDYDAHIKRYEGLIS